MELRKQSEVEESNSEMKIKLEETHESVTNT